MNENTTYGLKINVSYLLKKHNKSFAFPISYFVKSQHTMETTYGVITIHSKSLIAYSIYGAFGKVFKTL